MPGQTDFFTVSLRFASSGTPAATLAQDTYQAWAKSAPAQLNWSDRRIIGTVYLASSPVGNPNVFGGYPNNPRSYFNNSNAAVFDIRNSAGLAKFQNQILQQAQKTVQNLKKLGAQGAVTWDIEGEAFPQPTSYASAPDQIAQLAPEMESVVTAATSPYRGMRLDDAYVDSSVNANGATLDPGIFRQAAAALPDSRERRGACTPQLVERDTCIRKVMRQNARPRPACPRQTDRTLLAQTPSVPAAIRVPGSTDRTADRPVPVSIADTVLRQTAARCRITRR